MKVKDLQKIFTQALNYFNKYKPSDVVICEINDEYDQNYWRAHPYLTVDNGEIEKCGIRLSQKSRGGTNQIMTAAEYEDFITNNNFEGPKNIVEIREIKKILTTASRELEKYNDEDVIDYTNTYRPTDAVKPFISIYDNDLNDEDFHFISLDNMRIIKDKDNVTIESKDFSFDQLKKLITESDKTPKREILEFAELWIDEEINEDNPDYTFRKVKDYARYGRRSGLDYVSIAIGVLDKFSKYMSPESNAILDDFVSTQENPENTKLVKDAIDFAVGQLAASISIDS